MQFTSYFPSVAGPPFPRRPFKIKIINQAIVYTLVGLVFKLQVYMRAN